jgi:hypothetical protein
MAPRRWEGYDAWGLVLLFWSRVWGRGGARGRCQGAGLADFPCVTLGIARREMLLLYWDCNIDNNSPI